MLNSKRICNEYKIITSTPTSHKIEMVNNDIYHWNAWISGPEESIYHGYQFQLDIMLPKEYPISAPVVKFITPVLHINVNTFGDICLDILKDNWSPKINIMAILDAISILLGYPNHESPFNDELEKTYRTDKDLYNKMIHNHCETHALKKQ